MMPNEVLLIQIFRISLLNQWKNDIVRIMTFSNWLKFLRIPGFKLQEFKGGHLLHNKNN